MNMHTNMYNEALHRDLVALHFTEARELSRWAVSGCRC